MISRHTAQAFSNAPFGTRFRHGSFVGMNLFMTVGMKQHSIFCSVTAAPRTPDNVMAMPSRYLGNLLVADGTQTVLLFPKAKQFPSAAKVVFHFDIETILKIDLPFRVIRVSCTFDFNVSFDGRGRRILKEDSTSRAVLLFHVSVEHPMAQTFDAEVFVFNPASASAGVSALCPLPQASVNGRAHGSEGVFADHMAMVIRPSPYLAIQQSNQAACFGSHVCLHRCSDVLKKRLYVLPASA